MSAPAPIALGYPSHQRSIVVIRARGEHGFSDTSTTTSTMPVHAVKQNETLFTIARQHGFRNWRVIYEHPNNGRLRKLRPDPMVLAPGDSVFVPDKEPSEFNNATGRSHRFRLHAPKCFVSVNLQDETGAPYRRCKYELSVAGQTLQGLTSDAGLVCHEVRDDVREAELTLWTDPEDPSHVSRWTLQIGALDPIDTVSGVQSRLNNLGYPVGEITGAMNDATRAALRDFQQSLGYDPPTGEIDDQTHRALLDATNGR